MFLEDSYCGCNRNGGYPHGDDWRMVSVSGPTPIEVIGFTANGMPLVVGANTPNAAPSGNWWGVPSPSANVQAAVQRAQAPYQTMLTQAQNNAAARKRSSALPFVLGGVVLVGLMALFFSSPRRGSGRPDTVGGAHTTARRKGVVNSAVKKTKKKAGAKKTAARTPIYPSVSGRKTNPPKAKGGKAKPAKARKAAARTR